MSMCVFVCIFLSSVRGCTCWYEVKYIIIYIISNKVPIINKDANAYCTFNDKTN